MDCFVVTQKSKFGVRSMRVFLTSQAASHKDAIETFAKREKLEILSFGTSEFGDIFAVASQRHGIDGEQKQNYTLHSYLVKAETL